MNRSMDTVQNHVCPAKTTLPSEITIQFPASRGLFSIVFAELTGMGKRDLCPGLKQALIQPPPVVVDGAYKTHAPCIVCWPWLEPIVSCAFVYSYSAVIATWPHITVWSLGNHGACSTRSVSTHGRGLFSSRPSVQQIQRKRGLC